MASSDDRLVKVKGALKSIYLTKIKETKGGKDKKRAACRAIHDQLKPSELCPSEFPKDWADRDGRNVDPMATPEKHDDPLQKEQDVVANHEMFEETPGRKNEKGAKARTSRKLVYPTTQSPVIKSERTDKEALKDESTSESPTPQSSVINFKSGRTNREALKEELYKAVESVARKTSAAEESIKTFVDRHIIKEEHKMLGPVSVSVNTVNYQEYISRKVIELSLAGQVVWETEDGKAAEGSTDFWKFKYSERKLIEAAQLYSSCKTRNVPQRKEELLPVMYWKEAEGDTDWVESSICYCRTEGGSKRPVKGQPPPWATNYIKDKLSDAKVFPKEEIEEPNKHPNAVYLLLCRFNGKGVSEEARVQAYAGRAKDGVEDRWLGHSRESQYLLQLYPLLTRFSALPLRRSLLVEVVVGRLYAQGGRKYITDNASTDHDNIALFVYRAYGKNAEGDKKNTVDMEKTEGHLIKELKLTNMECGMNGTEPKD
ncbi:hypothetical protein Bbelb_280700 [Branchiostoma belcheri]|nr:hypothetical protein Bbelb_280700 [Branchiostoma belcheri]